MTCGLRKRGARRARVSPLRLTRTLRVAADDLDAVGVDLIRVVELEVDVLDNERPDVITETIGVEMALQTKRISLRALICLHGRCSP